MFLWGCRDGVQWGISLGWQDLGLTWMWSGFEERLKEGNSKDPALGPYGITGALPADLIPSPDHPPFVLSTCRPLSTLRPQSCSDAFRVPSVSPYENRKVCFWYPLPSISRDSWVHALRHASDWGPLSFLVSPSGVIAEQSGEQRDPIEGLCLSGAIQATGLCYWWGHQGPRRWCQVISQLPRWLCDFSQIKNCRSQPSFLNLTSVPHFLLHPL